MTANCWKLVIASYATDFEINVISGLASSWSDQQQDQKTTHTLQ